MEAVKRVCYYIAESGIKEDGIYPAVVREDEWGYNLTDWNWGTNREDAENICQRLNTRLGLSQDDVFAIIDSSMRTPKPS